MAKIYKGIPYTGTLPVTLTGTKAGNLHRYKIYGNVGENLFDIEPDMLDEANWIGGPSQYFMYYLLSKNAAERLKRVGTIAGTVYLIAGGSYYQGEVLAIMSSMAYNVPNNARLLQNTGTPLQYAADVSEYSNIYLCIGYGNGITSSNRQPLIDSLFENFNIMLNAGTVPLPYEPYEECGERTANLFDYNAKDTANGYMNSTIMYSDGSVASNSGNKVSEYIPVLSNADYYLTNVNGSGTNPSVCFYDENKVYISGTNYNRQQSLGITTPSGTAYLRMTTSTPVTNVSMLIKGSTAPSTYIPYGYKLPLLSGSTPVDIYIGDDTISTEEYVDSGTGKIYRMVGGVLTPVDPPVPFPAIPTTANSTTISWAGEGLAPSQFDSIAEWVSAVPKIYTSGEWVDAPTYTYTNGEWVADTQ